MNYTIKWDIELDAKSPLEAAETALDCVTNGTAKCFNVTNDKGKEWLIDLEESALHKITLIKE